MDKINVEVLAQQTIDTNIDTTSIVDNDNKLFKSSELLKIKEEKRKRLYDIYNSYYNQCIDKIKKANTLQITDIFYKVPSVKFGDTNYNPTDCIEFILHKLNESKFDTLKVNPKTLFVSWKYLELY